MTFREVNGSVKAYESQFNRDSGSVTLIAVSKVQPVEKIEKVLGAGHKDFGENRVQESLEKWPKLIDEYGKIELHLVGSLQTNKAEDAIRWCPL